MKKVFNFLFDGKWGTLLLMQALFFGGLLIASEANDVVRGIAGAVWFGSFIVWIFGQQND